MTPLDCRAARRRLQAFHDDELSVSDQIAVNAHLERCRECCLSLRDLRALGAALRTVPRGAARLSNDEAAAFTAAALGRLSAEHDASIASRLRLLFDDLHLVYAGLGAALATLACVVAVLTMMRLATDERPDSLAGMVGLLATPGTGSNPAAIDGEMQTRWNARFRQANETAEQDAVFALSAVVTHEGRVRTIEHTRNGRRPDGTASADDAELIEALLDGVSRARFASETDAGSLAQGMVWLVTRTTVRATKSPALELRIPAPKRHAASPHGDRLGPIGV
jgi:Putative zinc-finger